MRRSNQGRVQPAGRVMRRGKTRRDRETGAWLNHRKNKELRRVEGRIFVGR